MQALIRSISQVMKLIEFDDNLVVPVMREDHSMSSMNFAISFSSPPFNIPVKHGQYQQMGAISPLASG